MKEDGVFGYEVNGWIYYDRKVAEAVADGGTVYELIRREPSSSQAQPTAEGVVCWWNGISDRTMKPCPFCGNSGTKDPRHTYHWTARIVSVKCGQCGADGPWAHMDRSERDAEAEALAEWNRRTP